MSSLELTVLEDLPARSDRSIFGGKARGGTVVLREQGRPQLPKGFRDMFAGLPHGLQFERLIAVSH
jgi:hypothetical protein